LHASLNLVISFKMLWGCCENAGEDVDLKWMEIVKEELQRRRGKEGLVGKV
jgi:hypothetical protein